MSKFKIDDRASIIFEDQLYDSLTLKSKLNNIITLFNKNVIDEKKPIGIAMERTPDLIIAMFAALCYGVPFVPIDLSLPLERINFIISNSKIDFVLTSKQSSTMLIEKNLLIINDIIDSDLQYELKNPQNEIAYLIYTSGSTGNPKGAEITCGALLNFIESISEIIDFSSGKRIACLTTVSFDIFFLESIMAIYKGLTVVLANEDEQRNPKLMAKLIKDNEVDMIQMTPSRIQLLLNHDKGLSCLKNVKEIMIGGESFPLSLLRTLKERTTAKIYNMYGPTETTIWSTVSDLTHKDCIDIGHAIKDTEIYIVGDSLSILPNGQVGEICIAGKGLAKGYVSRDDLTAEKFIHLPQKPDVRVYRTGDMGRYLSDGNLECLGRTDNQVKIRGHRIELEEIESYLNQVDGINRSVVIALETSETDKILEAFYTSDITLDQKNITDYLSSKLPDYMIPVIFKRVESFIQTANGKIDRRRVLECVEIKTETLPTKDSDIAGLNDIQKRAFDVIVANLDSKINDLTLETAFAGTGVDSITFITIVVALEGEFDFEFDDEKLLITEFPAIKSMVEYVESKVNQL